MSRTSRWKENEIKHGVAHVELSSWKYFHDFVRQEMLDYAHYVWRGQRDGDWALQSSLDRLLRGDSEQKLKRAKAHLNKFKQAVRGRRGPSPANLEEENEWWSLGQHHGLATPLLDWTESPFVALYFAFENPLRPNSGTRSVWALGSVSSKNKEIRGSHRAKGESSSQPSRTLDFFRPHQDENARLVAQAGLFTRVPLGETVDGWIRSNFAEVEDGARLIKLSIPESGRTECLRTLHRMNINHLSLFPDIYGSSRHCNKALEIDKY